ncbi:HAD family hydrolase [Inmirania thermothiophila]|uniref:HAD superfamily hydrolase (TIGR01509 family) n=1 Tax=Inmirania thermothiophila TaxID=1750597 RepID=A0A3N1Y7S2_9GAMM|nr:HAD family hydrolase [Inmirania thermothiophila]ROR34558.1 HAD superfamily hydrolase (TIGR01509 family) [Inmirania thermothiophila]
MLEAVIFDVDGTLADTEEAHRRAFNETFEAFGLPWHWDFETYRELLRIGGGKERLHHFVAEHRPPLPEGEAVEELVRRLHRAKTERYGVLIRSGEVALRPGVRRLIEEAGAEGLRLAVATTTSPENVDALLATHLGPDWARRFAFVAAGECVPRKKPASDVYHHVLDRLGLPPSACIALEDSANGVASARGAGVPVVVTVTAYTEADRFDGACAVLSDLGEPDAPCHVLAGEGPAAGHVTVADLRRWVGG